MRKQLQRGCLMQSTYLKLRDNGGITADRYTFIIVDNELNISHFYSFSDDPSGPKGINKYLGSSNDGIADGSYLGEVAYFINIPADVRNAIFERYNEYRQKVISDMKALVLKLEAKCREGDLSKKEQIQYNDLVDALSEVLAA